MSPSDLQAALSPQRAAAATESTYMTPSDLREMLSPEPGTKQHSAGASTDEDERGDSEEQPLVGSDASRRGITLTTF
jgi:hypothetical protein